SENAINFGFALRSNKLSALEYLKQRLFVFFSDSEFETSASGDYPPWEFVENSQLQEIYKTCFKAQFGVSPKVEALHAGLECGVFSAKIENLDCISIGPQLYDVHTTGEKLSISSTERIFNLVLKILEKCK
ncbi:MAG: aminoacyl-histidine dipeptidase, partial [Clostridia bacterium]|nr:aminoacyl-histidine dipeptidase [Clostridia bacterium]